MGWVVGGVIAGVALTPLVLFFLRLQRRGPKRAEVALTIDDGPHPLSTPALLDTLQRLGVRATMFCPSDRATRHPELMARMRALGHELGNHSARHAWHMGFWSRHSALADLQRAERELGPTRWFRPVAGVATPPLLAAARMLGLRAVGWTARAKDGSPWSPSSQAMLRRLCRGLVPGGILVAHDVPKSALVAVLPDLVAEAERRGLRFVLLSEWLEAR